MNISGSENRDPSWGGRCRNWEEDKSFSESRNVHMEKVNFRALEKNVCANKEMNIPT